MGEVNRTVCGRDHVLDRRASEYKRGGGIGSSYRESDLSQGVLMLNPAEDIHG